MQPFLFIALFAPLVFCYDAKYDAIEIDKILADDTLFNSYIGCMLEKGPCTLQYSSDFKNLLPEVIATACEKCSPIQKANVRKTVKALEERKPAEFKAFKEKYDPKGEYEAKFTAFVSGTD